MKKLLSLALVLTMLFTIISVPSASAATQEIVLAEADLANAESYAKIDGIGPDGWTGGSSVSASRSAASYTVDTKTYSNTVKTALTNSTAAKATHSGVAAIGENVPLIKLTQTSIASIFRIFFADGDLSLQAGDKLTISFKMYADDPYTSVPYKENGVSVPGTKGTNPMNFKWNACYATAGSGGQGSGGGEKTYTTGQWQDVYVVNNVTITDSNIATYKKIYGVILKGNPNFNTANGISYVYPGTIYVTAPTIKITRTVASSKVTVTKIGEGTVTGDGDIAAGTNANLVATPSEGYHFAGWYTKSAAAETTTCLSKESTYSFAVSDDTEVVAVFEKDAVNSWVELVTLPFNNSVAPSNGVNLWGKTEAWVNVNSGQSYVKYADEGITDLPFDGGEYALKFNKDKSGAVSYTGMVDGRINNIPGYYTRFEAGKKYKMSMWVYIASTYKGKQKGEKVDFAFRYYVNADTFATNDVSATVGEWSLIEAYVDSMPSSHANKSTGARIAFAVSGSLAKFEEDDTVDAPNVAYFDNLKYERFDGIKVTAEATNGIVYGTGEFAVGDTVTLNAGANEGYKFAGYYTKDTDTLVSSAPQYTFTVEGETALVAKFVEADVYVKPVDEIYHYGLEEGENGTTAGWIVWDTNDDGNISYSNPNEQNTSSTYTHKTTYRDVAEFGIYPPKNDGSFGSRLYEQKITDKGHLPRLGLSGRSHTWGGTSQNGVYVSGEKYVLKWWVYPVSMQVKNNEATPATASLTLSMQYSSSANAGLSKTFNVKVGEWNCLEWVFTANDKMESIIPGIRFDWATINDDNTKMSTSPNWVLYDNITVAPVTSWQFSDTAKPNNGWYRYYDQSDFTSADNSNTGANYVVKYSDYPEIPKASADAGDNMIMLDYYKPNLVETQFKPKAGSVYEGMTFAEAYAHITRLSNAGSQIGMRINNIAAAGDLTIGNTYKISVKVFIPEVYKMSTGEVLENQKVTVRMLGTHTGQTPLGDGKDISVLVETGKWQEVGYVFKATEKGATYAPSFKLDFFGLGRSSDKETSDRIAPIIFVDDARVDRYHVDDISLVISEDDTTVTAVATVNDIKATPLTVTAIIAAYDAEGKLVGVALSSDNGEELTVKGTATATYTKADGINEYVAFAWDNLTDLKPYVKPVKLGK